MPFVELITNVSLTRAQTEELALSLSACAAETLQKPEFVFGINVRANEVLTFAGNWDPCMLLVLTRSFRVAISARIEQTRSRLLWMTN
jgi:phenylpyruvate tautomerase